ncbi:MAG TPA: ribonuclease HII [Candidatus Methanoperedens sp.]|nr:ribonuclease HII [Candidatus Methanoperedens sp.]
MRARGVRRVAGVDEAGRGPLAGPVVAAAVIFPAGFTHPEIRDSKRLTAAQRERLVPVITGAAVAWAVAEASPAEIDAHNILQATLRAMERALAALAVAPDYLLVDGPKLPAALLPGEGINGGDGRVACIAAASILAKVHRDALMTAHNRRWPVYGFAAHKGYGTPAHLRALAAHGPCPIHRMTFRGVTSTP